MKKRKIQIAVISIITALTVGGAFLNNKYAKIPSPQTNGIQVAKKESKVDSKKTEKDKSQIEGSKEKIESSESGSSKESGKETEEKTAARNSATKTTPNDATNDEQEQKTSATPNRTIEEKPETQPNEESTTPNTPNTPIQPESSQPTEEAKPTPEPKKEVTFSVRGTMENSGAYGISPQKVGIKEGQSVMDVLSEYCRDNGVQVDIRGGSYVSGINNLYEFDKGAESGWLYRVNGVFPSYGAAQYSVQTGDTIEWMYTEDMGKDVGAPQL